MGKYLVGHIYSLQTCLKVAQFLFRLTDADRQALAPELIQTLPPPRSSSEREVITPTPVEHIWEYGSPLERVSEYRARYFWPVGLLQERPAAQYFLFDPATCKAVPAVKGPVCPDFAAYAPWVCYRASADMLREGIHLLNDYYYEAMTGRIDFTKPPSAEQLDRIVRVLDCLAGLFGYYPTLQPIVPFPTTGPCPSSTSSDLFHLKEYIDKVDDPVTQFEAWRWAITPEQLQALEPRLTWRSHPSLRKRKWILRGFIDSYLLKLSAEAETPSVRNDFNKASWKLLCYHLNLNKSARISEERTQVNILAIRLWQYWQLENCISSLFYSCPRQLAQLPIKVPHWALEDANKTRQRYQERRHELAQELATLPPFHAYLKTSATVEDRRIISSRKFRALPLSETETSESVTDKRRQHISLHEIFLQTLSYLYPRDLLAAEIRTRQAPWLPPPSVPPAPEGGG